MATITAAKPAPEDIKAPPPGPPTGLSSAEADKRLAPAKSARTICLSRETGRLWRIGDGR